MHSIHNIINFLELAFLIGLVVLMIADSFIEA